MRKITLLLILMMTTHLLSQNRIDEISEKFIAKSSKITNAPLWWYSNATGKWIKQKNNPGFTYIPNHY